MKTFTLRLTDEETEMLERMAYIYGKSKNKVITELMKQAYLTMDLFAEKTGFISDNMDFAKSVYKEMIEGYRAGAYTTPELLAADNYIDYAIEHTENAEELNALEKMKEDLYNEAHNFYFEHQAK